MVTELINGRPYQNTYEWAHEQAEISGRPVEDLLRERLGEFYDKRISFDNEFENGQSFRYGALNAGGLGVTYYDPYCLVLSRRFQLALPQIACLPGDTLKICLAPDGSFEMPADTEARIATPNHWHLVVAIDRSQEITVVAEDGWPSLVVSSNRYFEVIFIGDVNLASIDCVRISRQEYEAKWDLAFLNLGVRRSEAERALINDFIQLRRAEVEGRVKVEVLP